MASHRARITRKVRKSILVYCEGEHEEIFIKYLKQQYSSRISNYTLKVYNARGDANSVLDKVPRICSAYDLTLCIYDLDKPINQKKKKNVQSVCKNIHFIENMPCLEAFLLQILEDKDYSQYKSKTCKARFEKHYLSRARRMDVRNYESIFPKNLLNQKIKKTPVLKFLLDVIKGKNIG